MVVFYKESSSLTHTLGENDLSLRVVEREWGMG